MNMPHSNGSTGAPYQSAPPRPHTPTVMPTDNRPINSGTSIDDNTSRLDAVAKVTGRARYGRDMYLPNSLFVGFVRCPYGAGKLASHDADAAKAVPGVIELEITGDTGQYQGHNVGHVVAESPASLRRALAALRAVWTPSPVKTRIVDEAPGAPPVREASAKILADAEHVIEAVYSTQVQTHSSLETHGAVVDHRGDSATVYASTQGTFATRDGLDEAIGLPRASYEVICEYVGGGFGSKLNGPGKEGVTAARIAAKYKRPTYLFVSRAEDHLDTGNRPSSRTYVRVAFNKNGDVLGGQIDTFGGVGVARGGGGCSVPSGRYNLGQIDSHHTDVRLNSGAPRPFRAPGSPQGAFVEELLLDEMAHKVNTDPLALRLKLDTDADRREMMRLGASLIGWDSRKPTGSQSAEIRTGFGMGTASWGRFPAQADAEVVISRDGSVEVRTGTQDIGTGQRTAMAVLAADELGVPLRAVSVSIGSSRLPIGPGSGGSVTASNTGPAVIQAAQDAKQKLLAVLAERQSADPSEFDLADGRVIRHNEPFLSWKDACATLPNDAIVGRGQWNRQRMSRDDSTGHSHGVQFVRLSVDTSTGVVRVNEVVAIQACGRVIARKTAESQIIGGVIQGISYALFEDKVLDPALGSMLNPNLEMYKVLGTDDMPHIRPVLWNKDFSGIRPLGEPPTIPTAGAIAAAVFNAIGSAVRHLPITPDKVLAAIAGDA